MNRSPEAEQVRQLNRREAIRCVSALLGGVAFTGGSNLLAALEMAGAAPGTVGDFTADHSAFLDEIAETILPATKTPGAKAAKVGAFMALMVTDAYNPAEQRVFREGMRQIDLIMRQAHEVSFMEATTEQRLVVLAALDREAQHMMNARQGGPNRNDEQPPPHYFRMMKELALLGFFTSEIGCTQAQRYVESPGRFDPCIPYVPGEPAWASHA